MALVATKIDKSFGGLRALKSVSLQLDSGQILGLIGPNGSGKTTLLNVLSGAYLPDMGSVVVDDRNITGWPAYKVAGERVARTFQNIRLFSNLTVLENVEVAAHLAVTDRPARTLALEHLHEMDIVRDQDRRASTLSYGAQRRVEIARAVAAEPRYLLLDEPAAGMNEAESRCAPQDHRRVEDPLRVRDPGH